jgi:hypothetical protein
MTMVAGGGDTDRRRKYLEINMNIMGIIVSHDHEK